MPDLPRDGILAHARDVLSFGPRSALGHVRVLAGRARGRLRRRSIRPERGETLRLLGLNLGSSDPRPATLDAALAAAQADLVLLQEWTPAWAARCDPLLRERYPHRAAHPTSGGGLALYAQRPLRGASPLILFEARGVHFPLVHAAVELDGRELACIGAHLIGPHALRWLSVRRAQLRDLLQRVQGEARPLLVAGSLNAPPGSPEDARFRAEGLREAEALSGHRGGGTWPPRGWGRLLLGGGLRLDACYLRVPELVCLESSTWAVPGSDHTAWAVTVAWAAG